MEFKSLNGETIHNGSLVEWKISDNQVQPMRGVVQSIHDDGNGVYRGKHNAFMVVLRPVQDMLFTTFIAGSNQRAREISVPLDNPSIRLLSIRQSNY